MPHGNAGFALYMKMSKVGRSTLQSDPSQPDSLHYLLNAMNNIKLGNVTSSYIRSKPGRTQSEGVLYKITFSGNQVNGDIPLLVVSSNAMTGDQKTTSVTEFYRGHQIKGQFKLAFEGQTTLAIDVGVCPMPTNPNNDYATDCQQSKSVSATSASDFYCADC